MLAAVRRFAIQASVVSLFCATTLLFGQQPSFDGTWQMDTAKSHVSDGRIVTMTITTFDSGSSIKMTIVTKTGDGQDTTSEFTTKLNGKACEFNEGSHKSTLTVWYDGPTLNVCKENGPASDVTSVWKLDLSPDKQSMTMKINHYVPAGEDETIVFNKKAS